MQAKTIDEAIKKGAVMIYGADWMAIKDSNDNAIAKAILLVVRDCWNQDVQDELGNGFLGEPKDRSDEVSREHPGEIAIIYRLLMQSNRNARKAYIRSNSALKKAIDKLSIKA